MNHSGRTLDWHCDEIENGGRSETCGPYYAITAMTKVGKTKRSLTTCSFSQVAT